MSTAVIYLRVSTAAQASKGGQDEGFSLPAQREACIRKATDLEADVIEEFVDAGESARSADRPGLQRLLARLAEPDHDIEYLIVHKVDRLARNRADDVTISLALNLNPSFWVRCEGAAGRDGRVGWLRAGASAEASVVVGPGRMWAG